jgi:sulfofructose kinase
VSHRNVTSERAARGIVAVGMATLDTYIEVDEIPLPDGKHLGTLSGPFHGGMATNFAANLSLLNLSTKVVTWAGSPCQEDLPPTNYHKAFASLYSDGGTLPKVFIFHESRQGKSAAILTGYGRPSWLTPDQIHAISAGGLIYYDGSWPEIVPQLLSIVENSGALLFANCEFPRPEDLAVLRRSNVGVVTEKCWFPSDMASVADCERAILEHWTDSLFWMGITLGKRGSVFFDGGRFTHMPAIETNEHDTTGAGDAFQSGLAYGLAHDWSLHKSLVLASHLGALQCEHVGSNLMACGWAQASISRILDSQLPDDFHDC